MPLLGRPVIRAAQSRIWRTERQRMNRRFARILLVTSGAVLTAALGATAATAAVAATWTVQPGGAVTAKSGQVILKDLGNGVEVGCPSSTIKATLKSGSGLSGTGIGSVSSFSFATCTGPISIQYTLTLNHLPFTLNATSYNPGTGTTTGKITGIHGTFSGPGCSYVLDGTGAGKNDGTLTVSYVNSTNKLKLLTTVGNLHIYDLIGCGGLGGVKNNDPLTLSGTGTVTPAQTITSP
jgi:hypothetical protein